MNKKIAFTAFFILNIFVFCLLVYSKSYAQGSVIATIPRATHTMTTELIDDVPAHVLVINNMEGLPDYKYQFLTGGVRLYIDRKDAFGWVPLISQVQTAPEYLRHQGAPGNSTWNPYGLSISTTGGNVLQGFDRQDQDDESIMLVRTYNTFEEGIAETLTEEWSIPSDTLDLEKKGPKVSYSMTKNRGIVLDSGVEEGTWRMRWNISGIADITANNSNIKDETNWPVRKKKYSNGEFVIDVNDFDSVANNISSFAYNEVAANNKAEVLFFANGTTGERIVDPAITVTSIGAPWVHGKQSVIHHNGTNFFLFYTKGSTSLFARAAPTIAGLASANEQTIINGGMEAGTVWDVYMVDDTKFDIAYSPGATGYEAFTAQISGTTITPGTAVTHSIPEGIREAAIVRTPSADRVWILVTTDTDKNQIYIMVETGDITGSSTSQLWYNVGSNRIQADISPKLTVDDIVMVFTDNAGGTNSDGLFGLYCSFVGDNCLQLNGTRNTSAGSAIASDMFGTMQTISDTEVRVVWASDASNPPTHPYASIVESSYNSDTETWDNTTIESADDDYPTLFQDSETGERYAFYADSTDDDIFRIFFTGGVWTSDTLVDNSEGDANTLPVSSVIDVPYQSSRTDAREMAWCYLNANAANFDIVCDNLTLEAGAGGGGEVSIPRLQGGSRLRGGTRLGQ